MMCPMPWGCFAQRHGFGAHRLDDGVDDVEHRLSRAKAGGDRQVEELLGSRLVAEQVVAAADCGGPFLEGFASLAELARIGALEAVDRLLEVADHEQRPVAAFAFARTAEEL